MANVSLQFANPKETDVTVNSQTVPARSVKTLTIDNTTTDVYGFLAAGCAVTSNAGSTFAQREKEGFMLEFGQWG